MSNNDNFFAELQLLSMNEENTIDKTRQDLNKIVEIFKSRDCYLQEITWVAEKLRYLKVETFIKADAFMVQDDVPVGVLPEELQHDSLGFCRGSWMIFSGRLVYPVKDPNGDVMGFCGYDKFSDIKYLDSQNYGYKAKLNSFWGMEHLEEALKGNMPVFFTEGIVCALYLRENGFMAFALLGSHMTPFVALIVRWFGKRAYVICDSDQAGNKLRKQVRYTCPWARPLQSRVAKDLDDSRLVDPTIIEEIRKIGNNPFYLSPKFM